jgi:uncharacterized membrane protein YgdD (TMEM256/DUF423 family)
MEKLFFIAGSLSAGLGVLFGAFGAHALKGRLGVDALTTFETGVRYQMYHALALLAVAWAVSRWPASALPNWAGWLFIIGTVLFSGSLYGLSVLGQRWLGAITPLGGLAFIAGWACLVFVAFRN